ncbi:hypothetical protein [Pseudofrankia sp. BMG5.37]|uniref:hypothetical protein n=1 Tax=Pseudofrankia sp. BMG5.37 TaxID=3050035 RepID=UPI0008D977C3|nr:hypothetical protein [Pseudofrankia sp. BMG5.37]MDT3444437.1 hypothetical protein [Pseudofrankia sp. BMG5.37]OHV56442.1 hypothetical protein BCD48_08185 [Pseudofrankia sp. BMG5.36]
MRVPYDRGGDDTAAAEATPEPGRTGGIDVGGWLWITFVRDARTVLENPDLPATVPAVRPAPSVPVPSPD